MLQEFLRRSRKNGQTNLVPISERVPVLNLEFAHGQSGVQPTVENLPKDCHGSGGFCGGFLRWIFWSQNTKEKSANKNPPEIRQPKTKNPPAHVPPDIRQPGPKTPPQHLPTNPPVKPPSTRRVFSIEKDRSWRRLQSILSGTLIGCLLGMVEVPMLKCTCNP